MRKNKNIVVNVALWEVLKIVSSFQHRSISSVVEELLFEYLKANKANLDKYIEEEFVDTDPVEPKPKSNRGRPKKNK